jgi:adenine-specific DNA-methyltransferase
MAGKTIYGPDNPHPLSTLKTELVWEGKYDEYGNRRTVDIAGCSMPMQRIETIDEPRRQAIADGKLSLFESQTRKNKTDDFRNMLIWGDNKLVMASLLKDFKGKIDLIYIDPPFDSKADYSHRMTIEGNEFTKEPSVIERLAYKDTWTGGTDSYLDMLYPRLQLMKRLLAENGSIWLHLDEHIGHYAKVIMDEVFNDVNFINQIIWHYPDNFQGWINKYANNHNFILVYGKTPNVPIDRVKIPLAKPTQRDIRVWDKNVGKVVAARDENGQIIYKTFTEKYADDVWTIGQSSVTKEHSEECVGFDTQKPAELLKRVILSGSQSNDLVADFFAGSGTTGAVAEKLGRRWIMCELGKVGIQVTRARLVEQVAKPFLIENIGNYQREMIYLTGGRIWEMQSLILKLYGATPRDKVSGLGIRKIDNLDELVYVGYPDRPITAKKAEELALQAQNLDGRGYCRLVILGWDYEYNYSEALESRLSALKNKIKTKIESRDIPPDIYDYLKKAKTEEDIEVLSDKVKFYERPYLKLTPPQLKDKGNGKIEVTIAIEKYVLMEIPVSQSSEKGRKDYADLMKLAKDNFAALIDYWAIDWDYDGYTFKSQWQAFRGNGRKAKTVITSANEVLEQKNERIIAVRVVDIFGNDAAAIIGI